mgnify:CR=1 FL=1
MEELAALETQFVNNLKKEYYELMFTDEVIQNPPLCFDSFLPHWDNSKYVSTITNLFRRLAPDLGMMSGVGLQGIVRAASMNNTYAMNPGLYRHTYYQLTELPAFRLGLAAQPGTLITIRPSK